MGSLRLITSTTRPADLDTALSSAILARVAAGEIEPTLRLFVPGRVVAFGSQDRIRPGYPAAVAAVRDLGFEAVERLAGGRAAVFHEGTVAFAWATRHEDSKADIEPRFEALAAIVLTALRRLGIEGAVGETPGEYCPGRFSVHVGGRKVMGVGQRLVKGAAHVGGVLVVHSPHLVNSPLDPAYRHLEYPWSPDATGALGPDRPEAVTAAIDALGAAFGEHGHELMPTDLDPATLELAADLAPDHRSPIT